MTIPPKYEDVVAELEVLREGIIALNPESILKQEADYLDQISTLQQRLTVAEQRESEAREELLDLSRKLDVFYSRSHGIKNLSAIEDANDKSKSLQQRLTVAEQRAADLKKLLCDVINEAPTGFAALKVDLANRVNDALKPAEGEGS
ncbi:MAG: hypothetical protein J6D44_07040 [Pseudomonas sp.]|nr:hypothetical protein [Pseudomonas sp.]